MVVEADEAEDAGEVAGAAEDVVEAVIVTDPVKIAAMTAVRTAVKTVAMVLGPAVAPGDPGVEAAVEARKNSAWTRRPSPLWARLPLKVRCPLCLGLSGFSHSDLFQVKESKKFQTTTFSSRANTDY